MKKKYRIDEITYKDIGKARLAGLFFIVVGAVVIFLLILLVLKVII